MAFWSIDLGDCVNPCLTTVKDRFGGQVVSSGFDDDGDQKSSSSRLQY
jgi:hypothetical protein